MAPSQGDTLRRRAALDLARVLCETRRDVIVGARRIDEDRDAPRDPLDQGRQCRTLSLRRAIAVDDRREPLVR